MQLLRALRRLTIATIALFLGLGGVLAFVIIDGNARRAEIQAVANSSLSALCTLRHDKEERVASSKAFLREHPNGVDGISASVLRQNIASDKRTVDALVSLDCPSTPPS